MYSEIVRRRRDRRLPEDSGEWTPVPRTFKRLPTPGFDTEAAMPASFNLTGGFLPLIQLTTGGLVYALATSAPGTHWDPIWILIFPALIGLFTALVATFFATSGREFRMTQLLAAMVRGQFWWGLLLFVPCYGWGVLAICVPQCVVGTMAGAALAGGLSKLEGRRTEPT